ncbi:hypothetical protein [Collimonas pratensis]|uniref:ApeA N-terminal domain-containing protein n=1 Tax=Collimonas pratensis TaxID=279113 RepID=A0ABM5Z2R1_9BURK|nr:hypothetical protein [Collimonas pratensis]AMP13449.1 hypothetical protein CPter291_1173 [Collimonas pratensis]
MPPLNIDTNKLRATAAEGFTLDCREIRLVQNGTDTPRIWRCAGAIEIDFRKGITSRLVIFDTDRPVQSAWDKLVAASLIKSGEILSASHYFALTAVDVDGNEWGNPVVEVTEVPSKNCAIVTIECNWIRCVSTTTNTTDYVQMLFLDELDFPLNSMKIIETKSASESSSRSDRSVSQGEIESAVIVYSKANAPEQFCELIVKAKTDIKFPQNYPSKLVETVRFLTASPKSFSVSDSTSGGVRIMEFAKASPAEIGLFPPPLGARPGDANDFYKLLNAYLKNTLAASAGEEFSPISSKLYPLYSLKNVSLDAIALLVSVTVEGLTQDTFPNLGAAPPATLAEVDKLFAAIKSSGATETIRTRALSIVGGMKSSRAIDKLYALQEEGKITSEEITAWKGLRNASAHGNLHAPLEEIQTLLDSVYKACTLLNKLSLLAIKYEGKITDYSTKGWPVLDSTSPPSLPM